MAGKGFLARLGGSNSRDELADGIAGQSVRVDARQRLDLLESFENLELGWFWATDASARLIYISESAARSLGSSCEAMLGRTLASLFVPDRSDDPDRAQRPLHFLVSARNSFNDLPARVAPGSEVEPGSEEMRAVWWAISGKPHFDGQGEFLGYRGNAKNITAEREQQQDASRLAKFDVLTGLNNRYSMEKRLSALLTAYKAAKRVCALFMLDLDRFKQVNDTLGHPAGDELLKQVGQRLTSIIGEQGEIGRLGGDEFQVILPDLDDRGKLGEIAHRVIQMLSQPYSIDGRRAIIGSSVGIAIAPYDGITAEELVSSADMALYAAKGGGRGQFRFYSSELKDGARERKRIEEDLRDAILQDQLQLQMHYQPLVDAKTHKVRSFEALMRWDHPEIGWINPGQFIPIAEETSIISDLGEWALMQACQDAVKWPGDIKVAVNVSAVQFAGNDFVEIVRRALDNSGLAPGKLELEITESVFMGDPQAMNRTFKALKKIGVRLALDDFGTGYSSLSYLSRAPFDKIKIDQSFVRGATEADNNNAKIITAIVSLAQALGMETVAEGVESQDELELVTRRGATLIQGFIFSRALAQEDILKLGENGDLIFQAAGPAKHRAERKTLFRKVGLIHEDHRYEVMLRNLSKSGALIEGLLNVPKGTKLVLDLGEGQLVVATVRRSEEAAQGIQFETPLVTDGVDGLCTRHRISPYALAAAGMPLAALPPGHYPLVGNTSQAGAKSSPQFMQIDMSAGLLR